MPVEHRRTQPSSLLHRHPNFLSLVCYSSLLCPQTKGRAEKARPSRMPSGFLTGSPGAMNSLSTALMTSPTSAPQAGPPDPLCSFQRFCLFTIQMDCPGSGGSAEVIYPGSLPLCHGYLGYGQGGTRLAGSLAGFPGKLWSRAEWSVGCPRPGPG